MLLGFPKLGNMLLKDIYIGNEAVKRNTTRNTELVPFSRREKRGYLHRRTQSYF